MFPIYKAIAGSFEGKIGTLYTSAGMDFLTLSNTDKVLVTKNQRELLEQRSQNFTCDYIRGFFHPDMSINYGFNSGGYENHAFFITKDGGALSIKAVQENIDSVDFTDESDPQWFIIGGDVNHENDDLYCDHTSEKIEPMYGDD
ncbi:hypothetical protein F862_gp103 [Vibrio phage vB_VpaS_MAR10]|uniref:Uncharacterized protein n=1 Tax=Vibrio phage vB_VpaS_MAR10 TaxID=1229755 RepID=K7RVV2_9CAUD|nr:hypothetical protein F862_gp103 [Vibrio phage vB_VpaS_MAR10]AFV81335.1 hypothetical protein MAR10_100 [Vibrio phage vB_VpaS_MAR10]